MFKISALFFSAAEAARVDGSPNSFNAFSGFFGTTSLGNNKVPVKVKTVMKTPEPPPLGDPPGCCLKVKPFYDGTKPFTSDYTSWAEELVRIGVFTFKGKCNEDDQLVYESEDGEYLLLEVCQYQAPVECMWRFKEKEQIGQDVQIAQQDRGSEVPQKALTGPPLPTALPTDEAPKSPTWQLASNGAGNWKDYNGLTTQCITNSNDVSQCKCTETI